MLIFWVLQGLIDISLVALAVSYIIQRRRLLELEGRLTSALSRLDLGASGAVPVETNINTPLGSALSTLSERKAAPTDSDTTSLSTTGRYALAQKLLQEGHSLGDVSKRTSISETELALLRKLSPRVASKNYEAH
jgi:hypothetical protein